MAKVRVSLLWPGCAQGTYTVKAKGCLLAVLYWGGEAGPLPDWGPLAYVPVDPAGNGSFFFSGMRAVPPAATHVWANCVSHDFSTMEQTAAELPPRFLTPGAATERPVRLSLLTDMHLSTKPWNVRRALRSAESDIILLLGDSTNDGFSEQFERFEACVEEIAPKKVVLPVLGNHDVVHPKFESGDGCRNYAAFQETRLKDAEAKGFDIRREPDGLAWALRCGALDIIGLQCVVSGRRFLFPEERQLDWLERRLTEEAGADWHVILCHAPLLAHNPLRNDGPPYLDKNRRLQAIIENCGRVIFLSGHTHVSPNVMKGAAEWDAQHSNLYLNCGSVVETATEKEEGLMAQDWKDGCVTELAIGQDEIEIETRSVISGVRFPRGYYRFQKDGLRYPEGK